MTKYKPLIGIISKVGDIKFFGWTSNNISNNIRYALTKNGARTIGILPPQNNLNPATDKNGESDIDLTPEEEDDFISTLELCDGLILQGGVISFKYEKFAAQYAHQHNLPILGICAGMNVLARALGGRTERLRLEDDAVHFHPDMLYAHAINIDQQSKFYQIVKSSKLMVNSIHHYIVTDTGRYNPVGVTDNGLIEVMGIPTQKFNFGVKFHPELLVDKDKKMNAIFTAFIKAASDKN